MTQFLIGDRKVINLYRELPKRLRRRGQVAAGRKAARPILTRARKILRQENSKARRKNKNRDPDGFRHLIALAKLTKVVVYKGAVNVQIDPKSPDLPMKSTRPFWDAYAVARLFAFGRQKQGTGKRNFGNKGTTRGVGDWVHRAVDLEGTTATRIFANALESQLNQEIKKLI